MKVLYDHQMFMIQNRGGISRYFAELARGMGGIAGVEPVIFGGLPCRGGLLHEEAATLAARIHAVFVPSIPRTTDFRRSMASVVFPLVARIEAPDVFHPTFYDSNVSMLPRRTTLVSTVHDMIHEKFADQPGRQTLTARKRTMVEASRRIICVSRRTAEDLQEFFGVDSERIDIVHHATRIHENAPTNWKAERPFLLYVGQRRGYKNFATLRQAYETDPRLHSGHDLICFGGEPLPDSERVSKGRILKMGGSDSVLADAYRQASVFVYPSLYEGFGLPLLEAMALGCPVVTTTGGSIPEVAAEGAAYFEGDSADSLAETVAGLLQDESRRAELVRSGSARASLFSWDRCVQETLSTYRRAVASR